MDYVKTEELAATASARIAEFEAAVVVDPVGAVKDLRADLEAAGGPLVEPVTGDDSRVLVTFVWMDFEAPVSVLTPLQGWPSSVPMIQVGGTDVWHMSIVARADISTSYQYVIDDPLMGYEPSYLAEHPHVASQLRAQAAERTFADPFNSDRFPIGAEPIERWQSVLTLPGAEPMSWFDTPAEVSGSLEEYQFVSAALGNERTVTVYTPAGYQSDGTGYPLVVMLDGEFWVSAAGQYVAFDNLIAAGRIRPVVVAFVNNVPSDGPPGALRAYEMNCNPAFPTMLADELVPMLRSRYRVASDPSEMVIAGPSFGGLAAAYVGFERPEVFGKVLACSPAVWWGYANDRERFSFDEYGEPEWLTGQQEEPEWLTRQYAAADHKKLQLWVDVGCLEGSAFMYTPPAWGVDYRSAVRHFRTVLIAKGYDVTYYEAPGGHDWPTFRRSYVKGFQILLGP